MQGTLWSKKKRVADGDYGKFFFQTPSLQSIGIVNEPGEKWEELRY